MSEAAALLTPIDADAMAGGYQLVQLERSKFALVKWQGARWEFPNGHPLDFAPTHYRRMERCDG